MITTVLLIIIYLAFISLGLPDSILGVAIPALRAEWNIPLAATGVISMIIVGGSVVSSFFSDFIIKRVAPGKIIFLSCLVTGLSLLGFSFSPSVYWLYLLALPLGLGGGTVDATLNNYVASHFKAHHMNWLHSFWGVGATLGPVIMSWNLVNSSWQMGYRTISFIQLVLALFLLLSIPIWTRHRGGEFQECPDTPKTSNINIFSLHGTTYLFISMLLYCAVELGTGLWGSSFLVSYRGLSVDGAARYVAIYYGGITIGRFLSGFISFKLSNKQLIRYGLITAFSGVLLLLLPLPRTLIGGGLILIGLGLAPVFPSMIHETPNRFGKDLSQKIIGYQMGFAYIGSAIIPPLLGCLFQNLSLSLLPLTLLIMIVSLIVTSELLNRVTINYKKQLL